jgi:hypothetical protein
MLLQPRFSSNPALLTVKTVQGAGGTSSATVAGVTDFHWDQETAPRFWLGITLGDNWMVRANYWDFRHAPADVAVIHAPDPLNTTTTVATVGALPFVATALPGAAPPDLIHVSSNLTLDVFDLEGVYSVSTGRWLLQGALGLRHADLEQNYRAGLTNAGNPAALVTANFRDQSERNSFFGFGPTLAGEASVNLFWGFAIYTDLRGSLLYGRSHQDATHQFTGGVPASQSFNSSASQDIFLPITELEAGLAWAHTFGKRFEFTAKTGFVGQVWWNAGSASVPAGASFPAIQTANLGSSALFPISNATSSNLGFVGWTANVGVRY